MARILIINDDDAVLDTYEAVVRGMGHEPVTKETASSGPEVVRDVQADALIVDLKQFQRSGIDVRRASRFSFWLSAVQVRRRRKPGAQ